MSRTTHGKVTVPSWHLGAIQRKLYYHYYDDYYNYCKTTEWRLTVSSQTQYYRRSCRGFSVFSETPQQEGSLLFTGFEATASCWRLCTTLLRSHALLKKIFNALPRSHFLLVSRLYEYIPSDWTAALALQAVSASLFMTWVSYSDVSVGKFCRGCGFRHILPWGENQSK